MVELLTGPAKERCSLNVLPKLILKHHIAGVGFRALNSSCHGDWPWLLSGDLCDSSVVCWVMSVVLILSLPYSWSKSHLCAYREETCSKVSYRLCEGRT